MKLGVLHVGAAYSLNNYNSNVNLLINGLTKNNIEPILLINATKNTLNESYDSLTSSCDNVIITGDTKAFIKFLSSKTDDEYKDVVFSVDDTTFFVVDKFIEEDFENKIVPLINKSAIKYNVQKYRVFGKSVSEIKESLKDLVKAYANVNISYYDFATESMVVVEYSNKLSDETAQMILNTIKEKIGEGLYSSGGNTLAEQVFLMLKALNKKIAFAESYTAGGLASSIASISGASEILSESIVCYSDKSKNERLGVRKSTLENDGAVSEKTVYEMALGLLEQNKNCDVVVATTGFAGPTSLPHDKEGKLVGVCFLAVGDKTGIHIFYDKFVGNRTQIIKQGIDKAFYKVIEHLKA